MHFEYHKKSGTTLRSARSAYPWFFQQGITNESIEARYWLSQYIEHTYKILPHLEKNNEGKPQPFEVPMGNRTNIFYWSISHSQNFVAFLLADSVCGLDIAEYEERSSSLFNTHSTEEYRLLGGKNWSNFYKLWTAKEAIIKQRGRILDDMSDIHCCGTDETSYYFVFQEKKTTIQTIQDAQLFISYTS